MRNKGISGFIAPAAAAIGIGALSVGMAFLPGPDPGIEYARASLVARDVPVSVRAAFEFSRGWQRSYTGQDVQEFGGPLDLVIDQTHDGLHARYNHIAGVFGVLHTDLKTRDGIAWSAQPTPVVRAGQTSGVLGVAHGRSKSVAVATLHTVGRPEPRAVAWVSRDGSPWQRVWEQRRAAVEDVAFVGKRFMAAGWRISDADGERGQRTVWSSSDGITWRTDDRASQAFQMLGEQGPFTPARIRWKGHVMSFASDRSTARMITTDDGLTWKVLSLGSHRHPVVNEWQWRVAASARRIVALALYDYGPDLQRGVESWTSVDGRGWERCAALLDRGTHPFITGITAVGDRFVAVGEIETGEESRSAMWISMDGCEWTRLSGAPVTERTDELYGIARLGEAVLVLGGVDTGINTNKGNLFRVYSWVWRPEAAAD